MTNSCSDSLIKEYKLPLQLHFLCYLTQTRWNCSFPCFYVYVNPLKNSGYSIIVWKVANWYWGIIEWSQVWYLGECGDFKLCFWIRLSAFPALRTAEALLPCWLKSYVCCTRYQKPPGWNTGTGWSALFNENRWQYSTHTRSTVCVTVDVRRDKAGSVTADLTQISRWSSLHLRGFISSSDYSALLSAL